MSRRIAKISIDAGVLRWRADWSGLSDADRKRVITRLLGIRRDIVRSLKGGNVRTVTGSERQK